MKVCVLCGAKNLVHRITCWFCGAKLLVSEAAPISEKAWTSLKPSATQVGGNHYKQFAIQPTEYCHKNKLGHIASSIVKYATRAGHKGTRDDMRKDIEKIRHFAELWLELEFPEQEKQA